MGRLIARLLLLAVCGAAATEEAAGAGTTKAADEAVSLVSAGEPASNSGAALLFVGIVVFVVWLFNLVHNKDIHVRKYTWQVISYALPVGASALIFQASNGILLNGPLDSVGTDLIHLFIWLFILQMSLETISAAAVTNPERPEQPTLSGDQIELRMRCWPVLASNITGFVAIKSFGTLQAAATRTVLNKFLVAPVLWGSLKVLGVVVSAARDAALPPSVDHELANLVRDVGAQEAEQDIVSLSVSFLLVQVAVFAITGDATDAEAPEPWDAVPRHGLGDALVLLGVGGAFAALERFRGTYGEKALSEVMTNQVRGVTAMCIVWCLFFSLDWWCAGLFSDDTLLNEAAMRAVLLSAGTLSATYYVAKSQDKEKVSDSLSAAMNIIAKVLGTVLGLNWERVLGITTQDIQGSSTQIGLALVLAGVLIPSWRLHILPRIIEFEYLDDVAAQEAGEPQGSLTHPLLKHPLLGVKEEESKEDAGHTLSPRTSAALFQHLRRGSRSTPERLPSPTDTPPNSSRFEVQLLRQRNAELEQSLGKFKSELDELMKMAEVVFTNP